MLLRWIEQSIDFHLPRMRHLSMWADEANPQSEVGFLVDVDGDLWGYNLDGPESWFQRQPSVGNLRRVHTSGWRSLFCTDASGRLWWRIDREDWRQILPSTDPGAPPHPVKDVFSLSNGDLYVVTENEQLATGHRTAGGTYTWTVWQALAILEKVVFKSWAPTRLWGLPQHDSGPGLWWKDDVHATWTGSPQTPTDIADIAMATSAQLLWVLMDDGTLRGTTDGVNFTRLPGHDFAFVAPCRALRPQGLEYATSVAWGVKRDGRLEYLNHVPPLAPGLLPEDAADEGEVVI